MSTVDLEEEAITTEEVKLTNLNLPLKCRACPNCLHLVQMFFIPASEYAGTSY